MGDIGFTAQNSQKKRRRSASAADHLKGYRWPKGKSGNPGGRPRKTPFTAALESLAEANPDKVIAIAVTMYEAAQNKVAFCNPVAAAKFITERLEGKPVQPVSGPDGGAIQIEYGTRDANAGRIAELIARATERAQRRRAAGAGSAAAS